MTSVAVVTGASGGIGSEIATGLAGIVDRVVLTGRRADALERAKPNGTAHVDIAPGDVTEPGSADRIARLVESTGAERITLVMAAGGFGPVDALGAIDVPGWRETIDAHVIGALLLLDRFVPMMLASGWGRAISVSSAQSLHGPDPAAAAYATAKAAMNVMTASMASQVSGTGVSICAIHPGDVETAMAEDIRRKAADAGAPAAHLAAWGESIRDGGGDDAA
ncbi:MAG: SDR family oxidoreductase, partial [Actinobacteria bacterium]|nr:SDR family oxidoreductase [Actinomycetota bacterium]NIU20203.1 SDR family oxidoreductase [Actinomycetota bacterium]